MERTARHHHRKAFPPDARHREELRHEAGLHLCYRQPRQALQLHARVRACGGRKDLRRYHRLLARMVALSRRPCVPGEVREVPHGFRQGVRRPVCHPVRQRLRPWQVGRNTLSYLLYGRRDSAPGNYGLDFEPHGSSLHARAYYDKLSPLHHVNQVEQRRRPRRCRAAHRRVREQGLQPPSRRVWHEVVLQGLGAWHRHQVSLHTANHDGRRLG